MPARERNLEQSTAEQASFELTKLLRLVRIAHRRGDRKVCHFVLAHAHRIRDFIRERRYSQALHLARCRMKG